MKSEQTVVITGAAGNLGRAVARQFHLRGANLILLDLDADRLSEAFGPDNDKQLSMAVDLMDDISLFAAMEKIGQNGKGIGVLCNLAGGFAMGDNVHETDEATWDFMLDLNARTVLRMARQVIPGMLARRTGKVINVGAGAALRGLAQMGAYGAAKSAVARLTESMASELRDKGINVNCVLPSIIDTPENRRAMPGSDPAKWVSPDDLASVIAFLGSDDSRAIHGACIPVMGLS